MKFYQIFVYDFFLTVDARRLQQSSINVSVVVWYPTGKQSSAESTWKSSCPARIQAQKIASFRELQEYSFFNRSVIVIKYFVETYLTFCLAESVPEQTYYVSVRSGADYKSCRWICGRFFWGARVLNKYKTVNHKNEIIVSKDTIIQAHLKTLVRPFFFFTCCIESSCAFGNNIYMLDCHQSQEAKQQAVNSAFPQKIYRYCVLSRRPHDFLTSLILSRKE